MRSAHVILLLTGGLGTPSCWFNLPVACRPLQWWLVTPRPPTAFLSRPPIGFGRLAHGRMTPPYVELVAACRASRAVRQASQNLVRNACRAIPAVYWGWLLLGVTCPTCRCGSGGSAAWSGRPGDLEVADEQVDMDDVVCPGMQGQLLSSRRCERGGPGHEAKAATAESVPPEAAPCYPPRQHRWTPHAAGAALEIRCCPRNTRGEYLVARGIQRVRRRR